MGDGLSASPIPLIAKGRADGCRERSQYGRYLFACSRFGE